MQDKLFKTQFTRLGTKVKTTFYDITIPHALKAITPKTEDRTTNTH